MLRSYYGSTTSRFLSEDVKAVLGSLAAASEFTVEQTQIAAWEEEIDLLRASLRDVAQPAAIYLEFSVPRLGKRIDAVVVVGAVVFVIEFKVGATDFWRGARDQVWDYALDLKNFHEASHDKTICPVLVASNADKQDWRLEKSTYHDGVFRPVLVSGGQLGDVFSRVLNFCPGERIRAEEWSGGRYLPTPTIIEAATALYAGHGVAEISRSDAGGRSLSETTSAIDNVIDQCRKKRTKAICFVTGVPGAGKTLIGLNVATKHAAAGELHSVFLSGNGPLVAILREALARDQVRRESEKSGRKLTKSSVWSHVKAFVQNVHHFRDEYLRDTSAPVDHIAVFDEAQRAWNLKQTAAFMQRKKGLAGFNQSEPEFLISCMDRHSDWAVVICLVGGGQEINTGEGGIAQWLEALERSFPGWQVHVSSKLRDAEYGAEERLGKLESEGRVSFKDEFHLAVSMRSFRAENVSLFVKQVLDLEIAKARETFGELNGRYPIFLCRNVTRAKDWIRTRARGSERYGVVVSSQAQRLKPHAIDVRSPIDPVHWFLDDKDDVRSSYYMEDAATEFHVQGLELDWTCVVWDGDFRKTSTGWGHYSFVGSSWQNINAADRRTFQKNAYRVLLTRARQGMVIVVPEGHAEDPTRSPTFYDQTFQYLKEIGLPVIT
jgi:hypothetical protein